MFIRQPTAVLPLIMSGVALVVVFWHLAIYGVAREADEGAAAHLFQFLMVAQVPIIIFFLCKWFPKGPRIALSTFALQVGAALIAMAPVFYFNL